MHAASRHGTPSVSPFQRTEECAALVIHLKVTHPVSDHTQPCLVSVKLMELARPLGHSPRNVCLVSYATQTILILHLIFTTSIRNSPEIRQLVGPWACAQRALWLVQP